MIFFENENGDVVNYIESREDDIVETVGCVYPKGAIYLSLSDTNPNVLFGGVWKRMEKEFLLQTGGVFKELERYDSILKLDYLPTYNSSFSVSNIENNGFSLLPFIDVYVWKKFS